MEWLKNLNPFTTAEQSPAVDPNKPLKQQVTEQTSHFNVLPNLTQPQGQTQAFVQPAMVDPQLQQKFAEHFNKVFMSVNDPKPSYHEFIAMVDSFGGMPQAFAASFNGFKIQGLTKPTLIETAKHTLEALQKDAVTYEENAKKKYADTVEAKRQEALQKQQEILKLQQEIQTLTVEAQQAEQDINQKRTIYAQMSQQYIGKISNDIANIEANVVA